MASTKSTRDMVRFRVMLESPPAGVDYGVQSGKGHSYVTLDRRRSTGEDMRFEFEAELRTAKGGAPDFAGPVVQGPLGERFVYIGIGASVGQTGTGISRHLKVPLRGIDAPAPGRLYETQIAGTAKDGTPTCATPKPFAGWRAVG